MNDTFTQLVQKGFRVTLGATATLVEALQNPQQLVADLQDPQQREANLAKLAAFNQLAEEWETKGTTTEIEARNFVNRIWSQEAAPSTAPATGETALSTQPIVQPDIQQDLQELTAQIAALRAEITRLQAEDQ
jgi:polyhydroxyalkanoate synthesis regulator phasin